MKPSDIFGIVIRTIGLILVIYAIWYLACVILAKGGLPSLSNLIFSGLFLLGGRYLLRGAPRIMALAYLEYEDE